MQAMAVRLGELGKQAAVSNAVPAETAATTVGNGVSTTNTQPSPATRIASLRAKAWDITQMPDDEYDEWKRHAVGRG